MPILDPAEVEVVPTEDDDLREYFDAGGQKISHPDKYSGVLFDSEGNEVDGPQLPVADEEFVDEDGNLTLEAETLADFLAEVDWDDLFNHEDVDKYVRVEEVLGYFEVDEEGVEYIQTMRFTEEDEVAEGAGELEFAPRKKVRGGDQYEGQIDASTVAEAVDSLKSHTVEGSSEMRYYDTEGNLIPDPYQYKGMMYDKGGKEQGNGPMMKMHGKYGKKGKPMMRGGRPYDEAAHEYYDDKGKKIADPATYTGMMYDKSGKEMMKGPMKYESSGHCPMMSRAEYAALPKVDIDIAECPEGVFVFLMETLPGSVVADIVDTDDLLEMLAYYIDNLPEDTLEDKARKALFADLFEDEDDEDLDEAKKGKKKSKVKLFKKGRGAFPKKAFKKKGGVKPFSGAPVGKPSGAHNHRVRMMLAMMHKGAIKRAEGGAGTGHKGGDWEYIKKGGGTPGGKRAYATHRVSNIGAIKKIVKGATKKARNATVKSIYTHIKGKKPKNWIAPEKRTPSVAADPDASPPVKKKKAKGAGDYGLGSLFRLTGKGKAASAGKGGGKMKAQAKGKKGKEKLAASDTTTPAATLREDMANDNLVAEGAPMAGKLISHMKTLTPQTDD